ncbi:flagellar basal body rod protein FlgB [Brevundimonas faecalis]|uniref:flagellar basal body rod protein FlgB n=1 Tax=Brevundimonas faecalis TaxID=947378 RepID=UPI003623FBAE
MDPLTTAILAKSLDGLSARAAATASNVANANTPSYRPIRVSFQAALAQAATGGPEAVKATPIRFAAESDWPHDASLRLDLELATSASTAGRYSALVELLNRHAQLSALAVSGGR